MLHSQFLTAITISISCLWPAHNIEILATYLMHLSYQLGHMLNHLEPSSIRRVNNFRNVAAEINHNSHATAN